MTFFTPTSVRIMAEDFFLPGALKGFQWIFLTWYLLNWHDSYMRIVDMILKGIVKELPLFHCQKVCYQNGKSLSSFPVSSKLNKFLVGPRVITQKPLHFKFTAYK